jgi:hypothetical protein
MVTEHNFAPGNAGMIFDIEIVIALFGFFLLRLQNCYPRRLWSTPSLTIPREEPKIQFSALNGFQLWGTNRDQSPNFGRPVRRRRYGRLHRGSNYHVEPRRYASSQQRVATGHHRVGTPASTAR